MEREQGRSGRYNPGLFQGNNSTSFPEEFGSSLEVIVRRVSDDMNDALLKEFQVEEVRRFLKQMHPTKSPGPDGMSSIFFQNYWDVMGPQVVDYVLNTLNTGVMPNGLNDTYICLIPKVNCL